MFRVQATGANDTNSASTADKNIRSASDGSPGQQRAKIPPSLSPRKPSTPPSTIDAVPKPRPSTAGLLKTVSRRPIPGPTAGEIAQQARRLANAATYKRVFDAISHRYESFRQADQVGFEGKDGLTGDIADIQLQDLISILRHIADTPALSEQASKKSARSPLFDKIYLMENKQQGWNLRLHEFPPGRKTPDAEELPHFHRWTLASKILMGGYDNKNYHEIPASEVDPGNAGEQLLYKYKLNASRAGAIERELTAQGEFGMRQIKNTLFQAGEVRHFPIELPHSVGDLSAHTGTGLTLAHTGKPISDSSFAYQRENNLTSLPLGKPSSPEDFSAALQSKIALLEILLLSNALHDHLQEKPTTSLTEGEKHHLRDCKAPNYLETSLVPALAIAKLGEHEGSASSEFSAETMKFLTTKLKAIHESSLDVLINRNQRHLENRVLSTQFSSWSALKAHVEQP